MGKSNMYSTAIFRWSPFVGCKFDCIYCRKSFQAQAKRQKHRCMKCYNFEPHEHPERLDQLLPKTGFGEFIFCCPMGDISFCSTEYLEKIVDRIRREKNKTFLMQSKNPATFNRITWPSNVILGTTLETNYEGKNGYEKYLEEITKAPSYYSRFCSFQNLSHPLKMITIEPILDCNISVMLARIQKINPCMVWMGYDAHKNNLSEPPIEKVKELYWKLGKAGIPVILKHIPK